MMKPFFHFSAIPLFKLQNEAFPLFDFSKLKMIPFHFSKITMKPFHFSTFPLLKFIYFPTETMQRMFPTQAKSPPPPVVEEVSVHFLTKVTPKSW
jgi:hypothetical protein